MIFRIAAVGRSLGLLGASLVMMTEVGAGQQATPPGNARPNILIAIADDWSFGHAGVFGAAWLETPHFDAVAAEGVLFTRAYTPNAKCAPSRASLLTGRNSWQLGAAANHMAEFPPRFGGFVEALSAAGYTAGFTGKGWGPGRARDAQGKPRSITGRRFARRKAKPPYRGIGKTDYAANFEDFLAAAPPGPWVFWYGAVEPHRGYQEGSGLRAGKSLADIPRVPGYWPDNATTRGDMLDYALEVEHFDQHLGRILAKLRAAGQLANTIVVVTSDHGMPFPRVKGQAYEASNHVPLAVRWPAGVAAPGRTVADFVSLIDVAPTLLAAAGVEDPAGMQPITGRSLIPQLSATRGGTIDATRDHVLVGKERHDVGRPGDAGYPIRGIVTADWLYLRNHQPDRWPSGDPVTGYLNCDGGATKTFVLEQRRRGEDARCWDLCFGKRPGVELYHLGADPDCLVNLAGRKRFAARAKSLADRLGKRLRAEGDPRQLGKGDQFDRFRPVSRQADFYRRFMDGEDVRAGWVRRSDFEPRRK